MLLEEKLLKKWFDLDGELSSGGSSDFDFEIKGSPGYVIIKLNGNKAELYSRPNSKFNDVLKDVKELSDEDITALKNEGYEW